MCVVCIENTENTNPNSIKTHRRLGLGDFFSGLTPHSVSIWSPCRNFSKSTAHPVISPLQTGQWSGSSLALQSPQTKCPPTHWNTWS